MSPSQSLISQKGRSFHTLRAGIYPGDVRFRPQVVGLVDVRKDFLPGMGPYYPRVSLAPCVSANQ